MANLKFADTHNMVAFLSKPTESEGFEQIVDFLNAHPIKYALTINPTIYISCIEQFWSTVKAKTINGEVQLHALVDGKKIIVTESTVRREIQLEDAEGIDCLPNSTIFKELTIMGAKTTAWNEFSSTMASAIICLATNQKFNFSKYIFKSMVRNLDNLSGKFLIYPRKPKKKDTQVPQPSSPTKHVANEAVDKVLGNSLVRAATTASSLEAKQDSEKKVLDLEKTKTSQANEIASLKRRAKKLEQKKKSRTHRLKRLYKVGLTARVESSRDEDLGEDASKQGRRINAIDADEDITLVNDDADKEMFDVDALDGEEVIVVGKNENVVEEIVDAAQIFTTATKDKVEIDKEEIIARVEEEKIDEANIAWDDIQGKVDADYQLAEKLQAEDQKQFIIKEKATLFKELLEQRRKHFVAKRAEEKRNKPLTKTQQKKIMITYLKNMEGWKHKDLKSKDFDSIKELFDKAFIRVNMFVDFRTELIEGSSKRAGEELEQESTKKQKVDEDKDTTELQSLMEFIPDEEEVVIDVVPLANKSPSIVDWKIHKEGKKIYYQIVRANEKSQMYRVFSKMLKSFTMEDLEDLYKLVKANYESTRPVEDLDLVLWNDLKTMFEPHVEDKIWKLQQRYKVLSWKLFDSCGVHCLSLQSGMIYMLGRIVKIKSLFNAASITAALIDVNAAQSKLVLLDNFNENYSKCLRLLVKLQLLVHINAAEGINAASEEVSTAKLVSTAYVIYENGIVSRNKARLVAQGYNQQKGINYDETYALVARLEFIRILLAYSCALDFKLFQMEAKSAFLNGFINEEVYMAQPPGFIDFEKPDHVYKLKKALYGLKQAPKAWYDRLKAFLIKHEYKMGMVDNTLFTNKKSSNLIIVQIYVDDIIFDSTCQDMCDEFAKIIHDEFEMSMMGELNFFFGLQIKQMKDGIFFNQYKYIKEMLKKFGLEDSKPMKTPMSSDTKLTKDEECESVDSTKYRGMIGSLLYITASRPDIMFSVCLCARLQEAPKTSHLRAVKRIFQ
ncbi:retrovirus-related pol polyprotein from transposon TNT 1-94 [Tanacetum coccineum]|uniref:Retrovirus-related pol polyprotein from transposon TNT 1-94 n=1 Tax=Tanacetum coccineum TaxID=301880 RepID=A0ABQ5G6W2_9ASTR